MSNLEASTAIVTCRETDHPDVSAIEILTPREVPLGGLRAMPVRRTLPQRQRSLIGAWCFADHYGPDDVAETGGMKVAPHPHTGLQTVSWLFAGEIEHRDTVGSHCMVRPGELNLMTAGAGIAHSEVSTAKTTVLHGMQLWVALPKAARNTEPTFEHYAPEPFTVGSARISVFLGTLAGDTSPVRTFTPLLGAEIVLEPGAVLTLDVDPSFELGALVDLGPIELCGSQVDRSELGYLAPGRSSITVRNPGKHQSRFLLLGGEPLGEQILMWWNFVGRSDEEIRAYREQWQAEFDAHSAGESAETEQFGVVEGYRGKWIPAPPIPALPLKPRG